jgi:hypothetical protein
MGVYLKFLGILIFLSGFLLGGLSLYYDRDYQGLNRTLSKIDKKYEKIGKELESAVTKRLERVPLLREEELRKARDISLMVGGDNHWLSFFGIGRGCVSA